MSTTKEQSELLYRAGYRQTGRTWYKTIEADGPPGLSPAEQEINRRGGINYGSNAAAIIAGIADDYRNALWGFTADEIAESVSLSFYRDWLNDACGPANCVIIPYDRDPVPGRIDGNSIIADRQ